MKRKIALLLAVIMLLGSIFSVLAFAEGEDEPAVEVTENYVPKIVYSNLNYADKINMMFAVPAPAALGEGESVKVIVWESREDSIAFSYKDVVKTVIDAAPDPVKIGETDYLVFNYDALEANQMTDTICLRPVLIKDDVATLYGELVEYSILEYVASAKGEFEGIAGLDDQEHIELLDSMLDFGAFAQQVFSEKEPAYYANDKLGKVFVKPVINGVEKDKVFSGFFKYEEGGYVTVSTPFYDIFQAVKYKDSEGNELTDASKELVDFQIPAIDGDITVTVEYGNIAVGGMLDGADYSATVDINSTLGYESILDEGMQYVKLSQTRLKDGCSFNMSASYNMMPGDTSTNEPNKYPYHGLKIVADPDDENGQVFKWTGSNLSQISLSGISASNRPAGFGDTIAPVLTLTVKLGRYNGRINAIDVFRLRTDYGQAIPTYDINGDPVLNSDGTQKTATTKTYVSIFDTTADGQVYAGSLDYPIATLPENGMQTFAFAVDFRNEIIKAYVENLETGEMEFVREVPLVRPAAFVSCNKAGIAGYESYESWITTLSVTAQMLCSNANWTNADKQASVELDGVMTPIMNSDGSYNSLAVQKYCEENKAMLIDDMGFFAGDIYAK